MTLDFENNVGDSLQVDGNGSIGDSAGDLTALIAQGGSVDFDGNLAIAHADVEVIGPLSSLAVGSLGHGELPVNSGGELIISGGAQVEVGNFENNVLADLIVGGVVNNGGLLIWDQYGNVADGAASAVPEPGTLASLAVMFSVAAGSRFRCPQCGASHLRSRRPGSF